MSVIWTKEGVN